MLLLTMSVSCLKEFEDVQAKHADRVKFVKADVSNEEDIKALAETALKRVWSC